MSNSEENSKEAFVFVHGYLGGGLQWKVQSEYFGADFNVITPDLPGFGGRNSEQAPNRIADFASDVLGQLSKMGVQKFHLIGHSMGGMIAQDIARQAPDRVLRQIFYGTGPVGVMPGRFEPISTSRERIMSDGPEVSARRIAATWFLYGEDCPAFEDCANIAVKARTPAMLAGLDAMEHWSGVDQLSHMIAPTLVLWGDKDRAYTWSQPQQLWEQIPGAELAVVPGCSHAVHMEKPDIFNAIVMDFLTR